MNLPAVLLFICFSAAYARECRYGLKVTGDIWNINYLEHKECKSSSALCARVEYNAHSGSLYEEGTIYFCGGEIPKACQDNNLHYISRRICEIIEKTKCKKNGKCNDQSVGLHGLMLQAKTCCSSEPKFENLPFLLQENSSSSNSGLIIGLSVGAVVLVILLIVAGVLVYFFWYKKRKMAAAGKGGKQETPKGAAVAAQKPSAYCG